METNMIWQDMTCNGKKQDRARYDMQLRQTWYDKIWLFLTSLHNRSMSNGIFPDRYKTSYTTPLIKKPGLMVVHIDIYQICLLHQSCLNGSSQGKWSVICSRTIYHLINSLHIDQVYRPGPQPCGCCLTFCRPLMKMSEFWRYSTCRPHLTRSTTAYYWDAYSHHMVLMH